MLRILAILCLFLISFNAYTQIVFSKQIGDTLNDYAISLNPCIDSGFIMSAIILGEKRIVKLDKNADTVWTKPVTINSLSPVIQLKDKGFIYGGFSKADSSIVFIKLDSIGNTLWSVKRKYDTSIYISASISQLIEDSIGSIIAAVNYRYKHIINKCCHPFLVRIRSNGKLDTNFRANIGCSNVYGCRINSIVIDSEGNYIVSAEDIGQSGPYPRLGKIDTSGNVLWSRTNYTMTSIGKSVVQDYDSGYIVTGFDRGIITDSVSFLKYDKDGNFQFVKKYRDSLDFWSAEYVKKFDDGFIISGNNYNNMYGNNNMTNHRFNLLKIDSNYIPQWSHAFGDSLDAIVTSLLISSDQNIVLCGSMDSLKTGDRDIYLIKIDLKGILVSSEEIYLPNPIELNVYPNPVSENLQIRIGQENKMQEIRLHDLVGKEQAVTVEKMDSQNYILNLNNLSKGLYILSLQVEGGNTISKKVVKR